MTGLRQWQQYVSCLLVSIQKVKGSELFVKERFLCEGVFKLSGERATSVYGHKRVAIRLLFDPETGFVKQVSQIIERFQVVPDQRGHLLMVFFSFVQSSPDGEIIHRRYINR